jgi:hypothetical protein
MPSDMVNVVGCILLDPIGHWYFENGDLGAQSEGVYC